ncbi:hypothetical protein L21SP2_0968 [Salinispira pacifica]|uniref:Uncharacterized protein n=2 Tax=Salinispira pacifica TaxID=1307761 RepID=V5WF01_9SPIO|nr:hypothetical protein L21SP2_0968 [Salinispira pacifica]
MGIDLAVTGNTGINLLNANGVGLFEMNFDLENGVSSKIGMGGYDMSAGTIMSAINRMSTYKTSRDILNQGFSGDRAAAMRMLASYAADETDERFEQLMNGQAEFTIEEGYGNAKTEQDENGRISMRIDSQEGTNGVLLTGIALIHEAFRNGLDDGETGQQQETAESVIHHTIAAQMVGQGYGMSSLSDSLKDEIKILNSEGGIQKLAEHAVENYDWSADYWKLTAEGKWMQDGSLDFDISEAVKENPELLNDPDIMSLLQQGGGKIAYDDMSEEVIQKIGSSIFGDDLANASSSTSPDWANNPLQNLMSQQAAFLQGTGAFVAASGAADDLIGLIQSEAPSNQINNSINAFQSALLDVQDTGLLQRNDFNLNEEGLVNVGQKGTDAYVPVRLSAGDENHMVTSDPGWRIIDPARGITKHSGIDLGKVGGNDIVASTDNSNGWMTWDDTFGLSVTNSFTVGGTDFLNSIGHTEAEGTVMSMLSVYGTEGVTMTENGLSGLHAGMTMGTVGNTGYSMGEHVDLRTYMIRNDISQRISPLSQDSIYGDYLSNNVLRTFEAQMISGLDNYNTPKAQILNDRTIQNQIRSYYTTQRVHQPADMTEWIWDLGLSEGIGWW